MKLFLRILRYLKKVWPNVILGIIILIIYATFSGLSLGIVYPIVDKIFVKKTVAEWKAYKQKIASQESRNIFVETKNLLKNSFNSVKEDWKEDTKTELIKADLGRHFQNFLERNSRTAVLKILLTIGLILFLIKVLSGY